MFVYPNNSIYRGQMKAKDETNKHLIIDNASSGQYRMSAKQYSENGENNNDEMTEFRHGYGI